MVCLGSERMSLLEHCSGDTVPFLSSYNGDIDPDPGEPDLDRGGLGNRPGGLGKHPGDSALEGPVDSGAEGTGEVVPDPWETGDFVR